MHKLINDSDDGSVALHTIAAETLKNRNESDKHINWLNCSKRVERKNVENE